MNCNTTDTERSAGKFCRSFNCQACKEYKKKMIEKRQIKTRKDTVLWENEWLRVKELDGWYTYYSHVKGDEGVAVLGFNSENKHVLVRREHTPCHGQGLSLTSLTGMRDKAGETIEQTAIRELEEESGYSVKEGDLIPLGWIYCSKASDYKLHLFAVDLSGYPQGPIVGDGTIGELNATVEWVSVPVAVAANAPSIQSCLARLAAQGYNLFIEDELLRLRYALKRTLEPYEAIAEDEDDMAFIDYCRDLIKNKKGLI